MQAEKRLGSFPDSLNFSTSVRSWIDKPRDLGLLFSHRNVRLWANFLGYLKIKNQKQKAKNKAATTLERLEKTEQGEGGEKRDEEGLVYLKIKQTA